MPDVEQVQPQEPVAPPPEAPKETPKEPARDSRGRFASVLERLEQNTRINQALRNGDIDPAEYPEDTFTPEEFAVARSARERRGITSSRLEPDRDAHKHAPDPKDDVSFAEFSKQRADGLTGHEEGEEKPEAAPDPQTPSEQQPAAVVPDVIGLPADHPHHARIEAAKKYYGEETIAAILAPTVNSGVDVLPGVGREIVELENSVDVVLALAKEPAVVQFLNGLAPAKCKQALQKISAHLAGSDPEASASARPKQTSAPAPPSPVQARAATSAFDVNDDSLSPEQWAAKRNQQVWKRKGR